jgi:hypothetical protein
MPMNRKIFRAAIITCALLVLLLIAGEPADAVSPPQLQWSKTYYGDYGRAIQTNDGGFAIAANNASLLFYPSWQRAPMLIKTDSSGEIQWNKTFESVGLVGIHSIIQTNDGSYVLSGSNIAPPTTNPVYSGWVIKTDAQGNLNWRKSIDLPLEKCCIIQASNVGYFLAGLMANTFNGVDGLLVKLDENGSTLWSKTFGGNSSKIFANALLEDNDQGCIIAGSWDSDEWLAKTDSAGTLQWSRTYDLGSNFDMFFAISKTTDGGFILGGGTGNDGCLVKTDFQGTMSWKHVYPTDAFGFQAVARTDGGYLAVASLDGQALLVKTDTSGNSLYDARYGQVNETISSHANSVVVTSDGGFVISGALNDYAPNTAEGFRVTPTVGENVWLAKFAPESSEVTPSVPEFPAWTALPLILAAFMSVLVFATKRKEEG